MEEDVTKTAIQALRAYLNDELPLDKDFIRELDCRGLIASNKASMLVALVDKGDIDCINQLVTYMEQFYTEEMLLRLCVFLEEYAQQARPKLATIASKIRQEILKLKPQVPLPVPEDPLHCSAGVHNAAPVPGTSVPATFTPGTSSPEPPAPYISVPTALSPGTSVPGPTALEAPMSPPSNYTSGNVTRLSSDDRSLPVYLPVIDELKASFCNLVANVFSAIYCLKDLTLFRTFLSHFLKPSFPPGALSPAVPKTVEELDPFLADRWNSVNIHLLKAVVLHLASRKNESTVFCETIQQVQSELMAYEDLLKVNLHEFLSNCKSESVSLKPLPGHSCVTVKIASSPAEVSLALIVGLKGFFNSQLGLSDTLFTGFSEGCTILFFSIPTECVWSIPSCLLPSNLSLLEEWKVVFFSVKGAFTVDIKERRVVDSLDKHSLLSSLSDYKILNDDLQTRNDDLHTRNDDLQTHIDDLYTRIDYLQIRRDNRQTLGITACLQRDVASYGDLKAKGFPTDRSMRYSTDVDSAYGASERLYEFSSSELSTDERHGFSASSEGHEPFLKRKPPFPTRTEKFSIFPPLPRESFLEKIARRRKVESVSKMQFSTILDPSQSSEAARLTSTHPYWRQEPDLPEAMLWPTTVCVKDKIFVCSRSSLSYRYTPHLFVFNVVTRRWSKLRFYEFEEVNNTTLATTNNQVHCLGGRWRMHGKEEECSKVVFSLDCDSLQWSDNTLPPLNKRREMATSTSFEGMILVAGGWGEGGWFLSSVEVLSNSQQSSTWWKVCDLPVWSAHMQCTVSDTDLIVGCGFDTDRTIYSCKLSAVKEAMVPGDSTSPESFWHTLSGAPLKESGLAVVNNCLVAVGGRDGLHMLSSVHLYDSYNNTWTKVSDLRKSRSSPAVVFYNFENKRNLFIFGGLADSFTITVESCEVL